MYISMHMHVHTYIESHSNTKLTITEDFMSVHVWPCLSMSGHVCPCLPICVLSPQCHICVCICVGLLYMCMCMRMCVCVCVCNKHAQNRNSLRPDLFYEPYVAACIRAFMYACMHTNVRMCVYIHK